MKLMIRLLPIALLAAATAHAQEEGGGALGSDLEKFSYAIGMQIGQSMVKQGVEVDPDAFALAIKDTMSGATPRLAPEEADKLVKAQQASVLKARATKNLKAGETFRASYKEKEGVKELPSGLLYRVIKEGSGEKPKASDTVKVNYAGRFTDGREFDSSASHGGAVSFSLTGIIKGWQEALQQMNEGSKWEIVVPPELGYGMEGAGGAIGPNETLVFEIELISIGEKGAKAN
ncbi:MAG: FKBP-type peptidyl-prolyl cis-trans isomerase [Chromatiales bacterium]